MSEVHHNEICPLMSRSVTFPTIGEDGLDRKERLIEVECLGDRCAWYLYSEGHCAMKEISIMALAYYERHGGD